MSESLYEITVSDANFPEIIEKSLETPILFEFWSDSCQPCKQLSPLLSSLNEQYGGQFLLARINIDQQPQLASQFGVQNLPQVALLKEGQIIAEFTEVLPESEIKLFLDKHLKTAEDERISQVQQFFDNDEQQQGMVLLEQLIAEKLDSVTPYLMLAYAQIKSSDINAAQSTLESVPKNLVTPEVTSLKGRLIFTSSLMGAPKLDELQKRVMDNENDSEAHYFLASYAVVNGNYESALEILLNLVELDPEFREQAPRKTMITIFGILGTDPLTTEYQKKLSSLLH